MHPIDPQYHLGHFITPQIFPAECKILPHRRKMQPPLAAAL